eukprot:CAMPEP_0115083950 /NCGR_PEP_ID=MMETSP0227-20121206/20929_1 /TAXON_ID=89957 /ORGANISM="Polarella glacialis, Strain CCMP 1383" /LENGTH=430 /DNA_ID=CAMNT_0002472583 /DNA_START=86 /DNA_END=1378 /DNA_ORIENTATION=-
MARLFFAVGTVFVAAVFAAFFPTILYFYHISLWKAFGEGFYRARYETKGPGSRLAVFNGLGGNMFTRFSDVKARLVDLDDSLRKGDAVRHNWLGPVMLASDVMVDGTFALGLPYSNHSVARPWLDTSLWGASKKWDDAAIARAAEKFLAGRKSLSLPAATKEFAVSVLASEWIGLKVPEELDAADFVKTYQELRLNIGIIPEWVLALPGMSYLTAGIQARNAEFVKRMTGALARKHPEITDEKKRAFLAAVALDSITFAGGLSVGEIGAKVVGALANKLGDLGKDGFELTEQNVDQVILETIRLYPAVANIAYERVKPFVGDGGELDVVGREVLAIGPVLHDPELWGPDAMDFKLRGADAYQAEHSIAFGELNPQRNCPGKGIALAMLRHFVLALSKRRWQVKPGMLAKLAGTEVLFHGYAVEPFEVELL